MTLATSHCTQFYRSTSSACSQYYNEIPRINKERILTISSLFAGVALILTGNPRTAFIHGVFCVTTGLISHLIKPLYPRVFNANVISGPKLIAMLFISATIGNIALSLIVFGKISLSLNFIISSVAFNSIALIWNKKSSIDLR